MSDLFTVAAKGVLAAMFLFGIELVHLAAFVTLFKATANTFCSLFVCVITVLSVKLFITLIAINFRCHIGSEIRAHSVRSSATDTVLAATIMILGCLFVVAFLAMMAIIASV